MKMELSVWLCRDGVSKSESKYERSGAEADVELLLPGRRGGLRWEPEYERLRAGPNEIGLSGGGTAAPDRNQGWRKIEDKTKGIRNVEDNKTLRIS